jgi:hypothetical protein
MVSNFPVHSISPLCFENSGPTSFIGDLSNRVEIMDQNNCPQVPARTRTPVMGTRTFHRRTLSSASSQCGNSNKNSFQHSDHYEMFKDRRPPSNNDLKLRYFDFDTNNQQQEFYQCHSMPYETNYSSDMRQRVVETRLYENISQFQRNFKPVTSSPSSLPPYCHLPAKKNDDEPQDFNTEISNKTTFQNSEMTTQKNPFTLATQEVIASENNVTILSNTSSSTKVSGSTGCTPTHSTPQDSFSDDSSYLSALSRLQFSPDNFLDETMAMFSPNGRSTIANLQRAMVKRTLELEESEKV